MTQEPTSQIFADSLRQHRRELDAIDTQLVSLLASRFAVTRRIGELKANHRVAPADPAREQTQLERLLALSADLELPAEVTRALFETLFRVVRADHQARASSERELGVDDSGGAP